jgi:CubicO group peptidase (beta-lactamase class C family)
MSTRWFALVGLVALFGVGAVVFQDFVRVRNSDRISAGPVDPISSAEAEAIVARARELNAAAVLVVKDGRELLAWGDVDEALAVRSMRKGINNLVIGRLMLAGKVKLDATIAELGIAEIVSPLSAIEQGATVQQLMESRSGIYHVAAWEEPSSAKLRPARGSHAPGTYWYYNNWDFNVLEAIAAKQAGDSDWCTTFAREISPLLGGPRGPDTCTLVADDASRYPAHRLRLSPRQLSRLAQILLRDGKAGDVQIAPPGWTKWSMEPVSDFHYLPDSKFNYGRLLWSIDPYGPFKRQTFMIRGAGSQYVWGVPEANLIIVFTVRTEPLLLRQRLGLIPDDNDAWTFGGEIGSAVFDNEMRRPSRLY